MAMWALVLISATACANAGSPCTTVGPVTMPPAKPGSPCTTVGPVTMPPANPCTTMPAATTTTPAPTTTTPAPTTTIPTTTPTTCANIVCPIGMAAKFTDPSKHVCQAFSGGCSFKFCCLTVTTTPAPTTTPCPTTLPDTTTPCPTTTTPKPTTAPRTCITFQCFHGMSPRQNAASIPCDSVKGCSVGKCCVIPTTTPAPTTTTPKPTTTTPCPTTTTPAPTTAPFACNVFFCPKNYQLKAQPEKITCDKTAGCSVSQCCNIVTTTTPTTTTPCPTTLPPTTTPAPTTTTPVPTTAPLTCASLAFCPAPYTMKKDPEKIPCDAAKGECSYKTCCLVPTTTPEITTTPCPTTLPDTTTPCPTTTTPVPSTLPLTCAATACPMNTVLKPDAHKIVCKFGTDAHACSTSVCCVVITTTPPTTTTPCPTTTPCTTTTPAPTTTGVPTTAPYTCISFTCPAPQSVSKANGGKIVCDKVNGCSIQQCCEPPTTTTPAPTTTPCPTTTPAPTAPPAPASPCTTVAPAVPAPPAPASPCTTVAPVPRLYAMQQVDAVQNENKAASASMVPSMGMIALMSVGCFAAGVVAVARKQRRPRDTRQVSFEVLGQDLEAPLE